MNVYLFGRLDVEQIKNGINLYTKRGKLMYFEW